jgi:predicted phosphodiesterase
MKVIEHAFDVWGDCFKLVLLGDLHIGSGGTDEGLVQTVATRLEEPGTYWIDLGDAIDAINMSDPRFSYAELPDWIGTKDLGDLMSCQVSRYKHYFGKLGKTCLARLSGNHEDVVQKHYERDVYRALNDAVNLEENRALGYSGFVRLRFRQRSGEKVVNTWTQTLYISHGGGGGKLAGSKATNLERLPMAWGADIYAMGHTHTKMVIQKRIVGVEPRRNQIEDRQLIMVNVGAFMRGDSGYAERRMLYPQALGPVELWFYPADKQIRVIQ